MTLLAHQILNNPNLCTKILNEMSIKGLKDMAIDIRAEVGAGLLSDTLASDRLNLIAGILLEKEMEDKEIKSKYMIDVSDLYPHVMSIT